MQPEDTIPVLRRLLGHGNAYEGDAGRLPAAERQVLATARQLGLLTRNYALTQEGRSAIKGVRKRNAPKAGLLEMEAKPARVQRLGKAWRRRYAQRAMGIAPGGVQRVRRYGQ